MAHGMQAHSFKDNALKNSSRKVKRMFMVTPTVEEGSTRRISLGAEH